VKSYDYLVIGSGFGGSVAALRLAQKGYTVAVLEAGRRWQPADFPTSSWQARKYIWAPGLGLRGLQHIAQLRHLLVVRGLGVGGGSLIYGNTLFEPLPSFYELPAIAALGGQEALAPYYALAKKMLGVVPNTRLFAPDEVLRKVSESYGRGDTFAPSPVGVFFGEADQEVADPYFLGDGPPRTGCTHCAACFTGCRVGAKNSLDLNYLYLAEQLGVEIIPDTTVTAIRPLDEDGSAGYAVDTQHSGFWGRGQRTWQPGAVVVAAGVLGTLSLLFRNKQEGCLPGLSARLGHDVRSNSETIVGATARHGRIDFAQGLSASSSMFPDEHTQVQADRYGAGSDAIAVLSTLLVGGGGRIRRMFRLLGAVLRHPIDFLRSVVPFGFAKRSMLLVVMQDYDTSLCLVPKRRWYWPWRRRLVSKLYRGQALPTYIPIANDVAKRVAKEMDGFARSSLSEVFLAAPVTAHILGGCAMAASADEGVVDQRHRVFGYQNLSVCDATVIPANLGVNPALSILAFSERALSFVPSKEGQTFRHLEVDAAWEIEKFLQRD